MENYLYELGAEVWVRKDLVVGERYYMHSGPGKDATTDVVTPEMLEMKGKKLHISRRDWGKYKLQEDENNCWWTDDMFGTPNRIFRSLI